MSDELGQVLIDAVDDIASHKVKADVVKIEYVAELLGRIKDAAEDFTTWLSEPDAMIKSGLSERTLRRRFREMLECGTARYSRASGREYLAKCIPPRANLSAARARGRGSKVA